MVKKQLISPEFRISTQHYEMTAGCEVECFSSREAKCDWCRVGLTTQYNGIVTYEADEEAVVELGYEDDYDTLLTGYCRKNQNDSWKEIIIRDDMIKLEKTIIKASFVDCTPQDIIRYILTQAGVEDYVLTQEAYGTKSTFFVNRQNGVEAIMEMNSFWGIENDFFFRDKIFYWGCSPAQELVYVLEENENILSLNKYGELWEIETLGVPWIHHSQVVEVNHSKFSGTVKVEKTIVKSSSGGYTRMYIYFKGG